MKALKNESSPDQPGLEGERLLIEAARVDPEAFGELYEHNFARVYRFLARRVFTREEAQDLTAEVFHQALAGFENYEFRGRPFVAWLLGIAAHVLAQHWQRIAKRQEVLEEDVDVAATGGEIEIRAILEQIVDELPADQRRVILKRFVEDRSIREIAWELKRSEGAVKQLQLRALENLREKMRSRNE